MLFYQFVFNEAKQQSFYSAVILPLDVRNTKPAIPLGFEPFIKMPNFFINLLNLDLCFIVFWLQCIICQCILAKTLTNYVLDAEFFLLRIKQKKNVIVSLYDYYI